MNQKAIGVLAYGSLINEPGPEFESLIVSRISCHTPFRVEYARESSTRCGGPTLVPFQNGAHVRAEILVLDKHVSLENAQDMLYRRETRTTKKYNPNKIQTDNTVQIKQLANFERLDVVIYTSIRSNIPNLSSTELGERAIKSILGEAGAQKKDGIHYLRNAKSNGIITPLTSLYEDYILNYAKVTSLDEAINYFDEIREKKSSEF